MLSYLLRAERSYIQRKHLQLVFSHLFDHGSIIISLTLSLSPSLSLSLSLSLVGEIKNTGYVFFN